MRIGILSDTHDLLRPEVKEVLNTCHAILHAGDLSDQRTLEELERIAPLYAVRGNNDRGPWAERLPAQRRVTLGGIRFYLIHDRKELPPEAQQEGAEVIVFGHSHRYSCEEREGVLWLNPGSCGKRRFRLPLTMAVMEIENGAFQVESLNFSEMEELC